LKDASSVNVIKITSMPTTVDIFDRKSTETSINVQNNVVGA